MGHAPDATIDGSGLGTVRIGAIDDHPVVLVGLAASINRHLPQGNMIAVATSVDEFLNLRPEVDLVLLDVELHDGSDPALNVLRLIEAGWPVLLFTQDQRGPLVASAFRAGASGVISKGEKPSAIAEALSQVARGEPYLSAEWAVSLTSDALLAPRLAPRELEALKLYAAGMKLSSVARRLNVADDTARTYLLRVRAKYSDVGRGADTKMDLYTRAVEDGILPLPGGRQ